MTAEPIIPAWVIAVSAFAAAWALWLVRPMPRAIRVSIIAPVFYIGLLYSFFSIVPTGEIIKATSVRIGLLVLFIPIIIDCIIVRFYWRKGRL